jgi:hypothetical protein
MDLGKLARNLFAGLLIASAPMTVSHDVLAQDATTKQQAKEDIPMPKKGRFGALKEAYGKDNSKGKANSNAAIYSYINQLLRNEFKIVYNKDKNKEGVVVEWYFISDASQRAKATKRIEEFLRDEQSKTPASDYLASIEATLPDWCLIIQYPEEMGKRQKKGFILADKSVVQLESEDEAFSTFDYTKAYCVAYEQGIIAEGAPLVIAHPPNAAHLAARHEQLALILRGKRKVSEGYRSKVIDAFVEYYGKCAANKDDLRQRYEDTQLEGYAKTAKQLDSFLQHIDKSMDGLGYKVELGQLVKLPEPKK